MQQLGGLDASFLYMETPETPMHVGGLYLYDLPPDYQGGFYENFKAQIAQRMHLFPIFTRKLAPIPLEIDAPLWVRDKTVDLDYHIRPYTLPKPGRFEQLEELVGRLHSNFLDRSRPLWEIYIIDGLADGRVAEYTKFHHAGFDGAAAMAMVQGLYDTSPVPRQIPPPTPSQEDDDLDPLKLLGLAYANGLRQYISGIQAIPDLLKTWAKIALPDPDSLKLEPLQFPPIAPSTILNVSITSQRTYAARSVPLADMKRVAKAQGVTVNDVVLAICSGALRRYLKEKRALPDESLTAFVPVSVRDPGNSQLTIQVAGMLCSLATTISSAHKRLQEIHRSAQQAKRLTETIRAAALGLNSPFGTPQFLLTGLINVLGHYHLADNMRPLANLPISNNVGAPVTLYLAGAKLVASYPVSIPTHGAALNITVQSYVDDMNIGLTACRRTVPDIRKIGDYIVDAFEELKGETLYTPAPAERKHRKASVRTKARTKARSARKKAPSRKRAHASKPPASAPAPDRAKPAFPYIAPSVQAADTASGVGTANAKSPLPSPESGAGGITRPRNGQATRQ